MIGLIFIFYLSASLNIKLTFRLTSWLVADLTYYDFHLDETTQTPEVPTSITAARVAEISMPKSVPPENSKSAENKPKFQPLQSSESLKITVWDEQLAEMMTSAKKVDIPEQINSTVPKILKVSEGYISIKIKSSGIGSIYIYI